MSLLFVCFLWFVGTPFVYGTDCPNHEFEFVAEYRERFRLSKVEGTGGRYWVAFGSNGAWTINLVDATFGDKAQTFKCKENYWGKITKEKYKGSEDKPICCVAHHEIDNNVDETNPFAVLPSEEFTPFAGKPSPTKKTEWDPSSETKYHWMLHLYGGRTTGFVGSGHEWFYGWTPIQITQTEFSKPPFAHVFNSNFEFDPLPDFNDEADRCQPVESGICDTGITSDIVAFHVQCNDYSYVKFGFKTNGIFEAQYLKCFGTDKTEKEILYYPVSELFREDKAPSYNSLQLGWRLGSFCASCPFTSFKKMITEKEAKMNKKRLQHSFAISAGRSFIGKRLGITAQYARTWFKEAAETLTSGSGTTISATCNGFYLWYWSVSVGTWGEGDAAVPTQFFYCTDRSTPPICRPKIAGMESGGAFGKLCNGHDVDADFMEHSDDTRNQWQSMHSGRPKPVRLQGQRFNEPGFYTTDKKPTKSKARPFDLRREVHEVVPHVPGMARAGSVRPPPPPPLVSKAHKSVAAERPGLKRSRTQTLYRRKMRGSRD